MITGAMGRIGVFCSYAREDEPWRQELEAALAPLRDERIIDDWYDNRIQAGARWDDEIGAALGKARLVIFLVSPDLLASEYVRRVELPRSLELERKGVCRIVPVVVRKADWRETALSDFQAMPRNAAPLETLSDRERAYREIVEGLRSVCKDIVDWENPYKRSQVGDWAHIEHSVHLATGQSVTGEGTLELVEKSDTRAGAVMESLINGQFQKTPVEVDLTQPLEDKMGDLMRQFGGAVPANMEIVLGPARWDEEVVMIGGRRYETVCTTRAITMAQRGEKAQGTVRTWRCIDVPLDGIVKGEGELPGWRQNQVLLDYGNGDAAAKKPQLSKRPPPPPTFGPGHWRVTVNAYGVVSTLDIVLVINEPLRGTVSSMGFTADVQGSWFFDPQTNTLQLQIVTLMMGMPTGQDMVQVRLNEPAGHTFTGVDAMGRQITLQRLG